MLTNAKLSSRRTTLVVALIVVLVSVGYFIGTGAVEALNGSDPQFPSFSAEVIIRSGNSARQGELTYLDDTSWEFVLDGPGGYRQIFANGVLYTTVAAPVDLTTAYKRNSMAPGPWLVSRRMAREMGSADLGDRLVQEERVPCQPDAPDCPLGGTHRRVTEFEFDVDTGVISRYEISVDGTLAYSVELQKIEVGGALPESFATPEVDVWPDELPSAPTATATPGG